MYRSNMTMDLDYIIEIINSEDHPGDIWYIETIEGLITEIEELKSKMRSKCPPGDPGWYSSNN